MVLAQSKAIAEANRLESVEAAIAVAGQLGVSVSALLDHASNVDLIDEAVRDDLRAAFELRRDPG